MQPLLIPGVGVVTAEELADLDTWVKSIPPAREDWLEDTGDVDDEDTGDGERPGDLAHLDAKAEAEIAGRILRRELRRMRSERAVCQPPRPPRPLPLHRPRPRARRTVRRVSRRSARAPTSDPDGAEPPLGRRRAFKAGGR